MFYVITVVTIALLKFLAVIALLLVILYCADKVLMLLLGLLFPKIYMKIIQWQSSNLRFVPRSFLNKITYKKHRNNKKINETDIFREVFAEQIQHELNEKYHNLTSIKEIYESNNRNFVDMVQYVAYGYSYLKNSHLETDTPLRKQKARDFQRFAITFLYNNYTELVSAQYLIGISKASAIMKSSDNPEVLNSAKKIMIDFEADLIRMQYKLFIEQEKLNRESQEKTTRRQLEEIQIEKDFIAELKKRSNF